MSSTATTESSGLDRSAQKQILKRFIQITLGRLARIRQDLSEQQQIFLDALPVMLHTNHPDFPCFVSEYAPCGICKYEPSGAELQKIIPLAPRLTIAACKQNRKQLLGLYLTGDCGTIIESPQQNIIVWVCHTDNLGANEISYLNRKCLLIEEWAKSLNLKVKFRIFDSQFNSSRKDESQRFLELDLFYRTAVLVAGRIPLWWVVPPQEERRYEQYASLLRHKNYVSDEDVIDFGGITRIPSSEYVVNGIEQLSYSFQTPYETCIRQLVTEIYISEQPDTSLLSRQYKEAVYNDNLDLDAIDPYVMVYRRIEAYLQNRQETNRLELIRRCFYYQVGKQLSQYNRNPTWQRKFLEKLVENWNWSRDKLKELDTRKSWRAEKVKAERLELVRELTSSYRFLLEYTRKNRTEVLPHLNDVHILGRKLYSWYERKAGKVDLLNLEITPKLEEENLHFSLVKHRLQTVWAVYPENISSREAAVATPLRRSESLVELVAWCHFNGIATGNTRLHVADGDHQLTRQELEKIFAAIKGSLPQQSGILHPDQNAFNKPANPTHLQLFVNVGMDPATVLKKRDSRPLILANIFDYAGQRDNVILNIESISTNSWGEIICKRFQGGVALLNCINDFMQSVPPNSEFPLPKLGIHCFSSTGAESTTERLEELFRDITSCYYTGTMPSNTRYILQMKSQFFIVQYEHGKTQFRGARDASELVRRLGQAQAEFSPVIFDRHALRNSALAAICPTMSENSVQVYFQDNGNQTATLYIIDEKGSILTFTQPFRNASSLLNPIDTFVQSALYRQSASERLGNQGYSEGRYFVETQVLYYEIQQPSPERPPKVVPFTLESRLSAQHNAFNVQAIAELGPNSKPIFNIYCDQQEFSASDWAQGLYPAVARFILSRRKSNEYYPCYISDLDLSSMQSSAGSHSTQTIDYLRYKLEIDGAINEALQRLKEQAEGGDSRKE